MENKLTDEEIVKALDNCITEYTDMNRHSCDTCPYKGIEPCGKAQMIDCLDLIHRLQRQHKRLKKQLKSLQEDMKLEVGIRNKEIERLNKENDQLVIEKRIIKDQKYEALQKLDEMTNKCNEIYWFKHYEQAVKDTAKEILLWLIEHTFESCIVETYFRERFGVEVE